MLTSRAGWILTGGRSSRMGRDKALLEIDGVPLALRVAAEITPVCGPVSLVGDPSRYGHLGLPVVPDIFPDEGPLAGMEAALRCTGSDWNLIVACDMPELKGSVLESLFTAAPLHGAACAVVPQYADGNVEPLCGVYHRSCHATVLKALQGGVRRVKDLLLILEITYIPVPTNARFVNLNTPDDLRKYTHG